MDNVESIHDLALKMLGDSMIGFLRGLERTVTVTYRMTVGDPSSPTGRHDLVVRAAPSGDATSTENRRPIRQMPDSLRNLPTVLRPDITKYIAAHYDNEYGVVGLA
jgi:hypothetical protein